MAVMIELTRDRMGMVLGPFEYVQIEPDEIQDEHEGTIAAFRKCEDGCGGAWLAQDQLWDSVKVLPVAPESGDANKILRRAEDLCRDFSLQLYDLAQSAKAESAQDG